jgi:hypothetical protein
LKRLSLRPGTRSRKAACGKRRPVGRNERQMRYVGKRLAISLAFLAYLIAGFFAARFVIHRKVDVETRFSDDIINSLTLAAYYTFTGYGVYFFIVIGTAIFGWLISWRVKDTKATSTFKGLTVFTVVLSLLFFLFAFNH